MKGQIKLTVIVIAVLVFLFIILMGPFNVVWAAKAFLVLNGGSDKVLITDGISQYIIEHNYECYDSDFYDGATIYIDSYSYPSYGDTIIISGGFSNKTCEVTNSEEVNIKKYYVDKVLDSDDKIIVTDKNGTQYLVEYGLGCGLSFWRYEGKIIDIDIGGSFLDGIGDRIYLFDSDDDCKVWDAEELSSGGGYPSPNLQNLNEPLKNACPANSQYSNGQCICNEGYVANGNVCITYTQNCQNKYGVNSYGDKQHCYCSTGYEFNTDKTACVRSIVCPANATKSNNTCVCNDGYIMRNNNCITYTQDCIQNFGNNVIGVKGDNNNSLCSCIIGYTWNSQRTGCEVIKNTSNNSINIPTDNLVNSVKCKDGFVFYPKKNTCIKIPENAHAVNSPKDLWLCNNGYQEVNNTCAFIVQKEKPKEESIKLTVPENNPQKSKNFVANIWEMTSGFFNKIFKKLF